MLHAFLLIFLKHCINKDMLIHIIFLSFYVILFVVGIQADDSDCCSVIKVLSVINKISMNIV